MSLAFATHSVGQRAIGNKVLDKPYCAPDGWAKIQETLATDIRDASGKGGFDSALILLEPCGLDLKPTPCQFHSYVQMFKRTEELVDVLKKETADGIRGIMGLGEKMSKSHLERFQTFERLPPKQEVLTLADPSVGAANWSEDIRKYAEKHFRMISGLYGVLRPFDDVKPVRDIPMGARIKTKKGLYLLEFWGDSITKQVSKDLKEMTGGNKGGHSCLAMCLSEKYSQAIKAHELPEGTQVVEIVFGDCPDEVAAKARCAFAGWATENKVCTPEGFRDFRSQEWSLDERRCTVGKIFYIWIGDDKKVKKSKKDKDGDKEKDKKGKQDDDDDRGDDRKAKKRKAEKEAAQDFSDVDSGDYKKKPKKAQKVAQDFSDMESGSEVAEKNKKLTKRRKDADSDEPRGKKKGKAKERKRRSDSRS